MYIFPPLGKTLSRLGTQAPPYLPTGRMFNLIYPLETFPRPRAVLELGNKRKE